MQPQDRMILVTQ